MNSTNVVQACGSIVPSAHAPTNRAPTTSGAGRMNPKPAIRAATFQTATKAAKATTIGHTSPIAPATVGPATGTGSGSSGRTGTDVEVGLSGCVARSRVTRRAPRAGDGP